MIFNKHYNLVGQHAFLSASKHHWINYDLDKLARVYTANEAAKRGNELHDFAAQAIKHGVKLRGSDTLAAYVNDAIGFRMSPETVLFYSDNCFGTADAIAFRRNKLRIHDLKTGVTQSSHHQLEVYAALFCLEYRVKPFEINTELRIYQNNEVQIYEGDADAIIHIMDQIVMFDKWINGVRRESLL